MTAVRLVACATLAVGCGAPPVNLGQDPAILWWADHETASLTEWSDGGKIWTINGGAVDIAPGTARSGSYALRATSASGAVGAHSAGIALREGLIERETCYSAWFYLPEPVTTTGFWLFYKFRARTDPEDDSSYVESWDLDVVSDRNGALTLSLLQHANDRFLDAPGLVVPLRRWFQVESCLLPRSDATGRIAIWLDDTLAFEIKNEPTMPSAYVEWNAGSIGEATSPATATVYVDDAAVSTKRLGPDYPVFRRNK